MQNSQENASEAGSRMPCKVHYKGWKLMLDDLKVGKDETFYQR